MKYANKIRILAVLGLLFAIPCLAQEPTLQNFHLRSTLGFDVSGDSFTPITNTGNQASAPSQSIGGEFGMDFSGVLFDPKFLNFDSNFNFQHGANSVNQLDYSNGLLSGGANVSLLPSGHYPFEFFYQKNAADTTGSIFGSNTSTTQLRAKWSVNRPDIPRLTFGYTRDGNDVKLAESLSNSGYKQSEFSAQANDRTAGWVWSGSFNIGKFDATSVGSLIFLGDTTENYRVAQGRTYRNFWNNKALFNADVRQQHYDFHFPGDGTSLNDDLLLSASLQLQHTSKLSTHYSYSYSHLNQENTSTSTGSALTILATPTFDTQSLTGQVEYQLLPAVRVFQGVQYQKLTPFSNTFESQTSFMQTNSGVTLVKRWHGFDLNSTYIGQFQTLGTNFANRGNTWSNNVDARVGWGQIKNIRLTGTVRIDNLNLVQQIGGFSRLNLYGGQAETTRFWGVRLAGGVDKGTVELLNLSGDTTRHYTNIYAQMESRRIQLSASQGFTNGVGSVFPTPLQGSFFIAVPLPVDQLVVTPLLDITSRSTNFTALYRPKYNLEIGASFRKESDELISSTQNYRLWEIRGRYNIGRITMDAGFGNIHNMLDQTDTVSGLNINRYWFRIRRTFNFF
jgi:hypothetical protein